MGRVFFATNRSWKDDAFGGTASERHALRLGVAEVPAAVTGFRLPTCSFTCDGDDDFVAPEGSCGAVVKEYLSAVKTSGAVPLLSIHGFQFTFEEALTRTDEVARWFAGGPDPLRSVPFLFTWPSSGGLGDYGGDRESARDAGRAIARVFAELAARGPGKRAVLIVHSSGAWALEHAIRAAPALAGGVSLDLFGDAVLFAADVAADSLNEGGGLYALAKMARRVTVVVHRGDAILDPISKFMKRNGPRLGSDAPPLDRELPDNVRVLDVSYIVPPDDPGPVDGREVQINVAGHQYYRNNADVRDAVTAIIAGKDPRGWRRGVRHQGFGAAEREAPFYWYAGAPMVQPVPGPLDNPGP